MRSIPFWLFALFLWIVGGIFAFQTIFGCCNIFAGPALMIKDGAKAVGSCSNNLMFGLAGFAPFMGDDVKTEFKDVAKYMADNPNKTLTLTGKYTKDEQYKGSLKNLGFARAESLKSYLATLGVAKSRILTDGRLDNGLTVHEKNIYGGMAYAFGEAAPAAPARSISISDGSSFNAKFDDNLIFDRSGFKHATPLAPGLAGVFKQTADYLKANPKRSIKLTGLYGKSEKYSGILSNLGLARANDVKNILVNTYKAPVGQISTDASLRDKLNFDKNKLVGGVVYNFFNTPDNDDRLAKVTARLKAKPLTLYFKTNSDDLTLNAEQRSYLSDLIYYMDNKKGAKAYSTGHTDNKGDARYNVRLGRKRARFVVDYLSKNGINTKSIIARSEGPNQPIDTNDTEAGRAKNRRVEISVR